MRHLQGLSQEQSSELRHDKVPHSVIQLCGWFLRRTRNVPQLYILWLGSVCWMQLLMFLPVFLGTIGSRKNGIPMNLHQLCVLCLACRVMTDMTRHATYQAIWIHLYYNHCYFGPGRIITRGTIVLSLRIFCLVLRFIFVGYSRMSRWHFWNFLGCVTSTVFGIFSGVSPGLFSFSLRELSLNVLVNLSANFSEFSLVCTGEF
jgi:hypothetical protein